MAIIRGLIYAVNLLLWSILGLLCWIPLLARTTASVAMAISYHTITNSRPDHLNESLEEAIGFYARGFKITREAFYPSQERSLSPRSTSPERFSWGKMLLELGWTIFFWGSLVTSGMYWYEPAPDLPSIDARISSVRFFESGHEIPPRSEWIYKSHFDSTNTRFVVTEMGFEHPALKRQHEVNIYCQYIGNSDTLGVFDMTYAPDPDSTNGFELGGRGWEAPDRWSTGEYKVECFSNGQQILTSSFAVH